MILEIWKTSNRLESIFDKFRNKSQNTEYLQGTWSQKSKLVSKVVLQKKEPNHDE